MDVLTRPWLLLLALAASMLVDVLSYGIGNSGGGDTAATVEAQLDGVDMSNQLDLPELVDSEITGMIPERKERRPKSRKRAGTGGTSLGTSELNKQRLRSLMDRLLVILDDEEGLSRKK